MKNELILMERENFKYVAYEINGESRLITNMYELDNQSIIHILLVKRYSCDIYFVGFNKLHYALINIDLKRGLRNENIYTLNISQSDLSSEEVQNAINESLVNNSKIVLEHKKVVNKKILKKDYYFDMKV